MIDFSKWEGSIKAAIRQHAADAPRHEREDLHQDILVSLLEASDKFQGLDDERAGNLAFTIAKRTIAWRRRTARRNNKQGPTESMSSPKVRDEAERASAKEPDAWAGLLTDELISRLSPEQQAVIRMLFFQSMTESAAAETMGKKRREVHEIKRKALERLKKLLCH